MKKCLIVFIFTVIILSACSPSTPVQPTNPEPVVLVNTNTPLPTATELPTATATATATPTSTPTNRPPKVLIPTATATYVPTDGPTIMTGGLLWPRAHFTSANISWRTTGCADEGKNLTCETEYRKDASGGCYVGMTCYDACGWYYSVNTIPPGVEEFSLPCY
ncbi:MAG: hypothetical protein PHW11_03325 [Anaerolineaceae bacterium]|nr:hypothetical protein [Anaerolineaceae bacterium]MDD4042753.1 hypothetical protein [Anaerolineaceae bacterium]MDD4577840.1 hypothetical protein [Anaerolineaceae bacterium]